MEKKTFLGIIGLACLFGCGGEVTVAPYVVDASVSEATDAIDPVPDASTEADAIASDGPVSDSVPVSDSTVPCGAANCASTEVCCPTGSAGKPTFICAKDCPASGPACTSPNDCAAGVCCTQFTLAGKTPTFSTPTCAKTVATCAPVFDFDSSGGQTRICLSDKDCVSGGGTLPVCCTVQGSSPVRVCLNDFLVQAAGGLFSCP